MHFAKWKKSGWKSYMSEWVSKSHLVVSDSLWPHGLYSPWNSLGQNTGLPLFILPWRIIPFSRRSSQPRDQTRSPTLQADSLPAEPPGKPKNTAVGSLSLLQWIFLTQESTRGLLHCRLILYQLSLSGKPLTVGGGPQFFATWTYP